MQKHGVKTLNRDRDSLKEEQNLSVIIIIIIIIIIRVPAFIGDLAYI